MKFYLSTALAVSSLFLTAFAQASRVSKLPVPPSARSAQQGLANLQKLDRCNQACHQLRINGGVILGTLSSIGVHSQTAVIVDSLLSRSVEITGWEAPAQRNALQVISSVSAVRPNSNGQVSLRKVNNAFNTSLLNMGVKEAELPQTRDEIEVACKRAA